MPTSITFTTSPVIDVEPSQTPITFLPPNKDSLLGTWNLELNWDCDNSYYSGELFLYQDEITLNIVADGDTFTRNETWILSGNEVRFTVNSIAQYVGTVVSSDKITGTMIGYENCSGSWLAFKK